MHWAQNGLALAPLPHEDTPIFGASSQMVIVASRWRQPIDSDNHLSLAPLLKPFDKRSR